MQSNLLSLELKNGLASGTKKPFLGSAIVKGCVMCLLNVSKNMHVPFACSPYSTRKTLVNSVENKAKAGRTFCFDRLSGLKVFF